MLLRAPLSRPGVAGTGGAGGPGAPGPQHLGVGDERPEQAGQVQARPVRPGLRGRLLCQRVEQHGARVDTWNVTEIQRDTWRVTGTDVM